MQSLKARLERILPTPVFRLAKRLWGAVERAWRLAQISSDSLRDAWHFFIWSHDGKWDVFAGQQESAIIKAYHGIEKGLSLPEPRPGFGQPKVRALVDKLDHWLRMWEATPMIEAAVGSLRAYQAFNLQHGISLAWLDSWLDEHEVNRNGKSVVPFGGTVEVHRGAILAAVGTVGEEFFNTRHSMRQFGPGQVAISDIEDAVRLAQRAPSACNRQGTRVYCFARAMDALQHQPGNGGFGHLASHALVVTADQQAFSTSSERKQAFIDGGIFAMALVQAMHFKGLGSCMLAWSQRPSTERKTKKALDIPPSEVIIMMIAIGHLPEKFTAARSLRRPLQDVLTIR